MRSFLHRIVLPISAAITLIFAGDLSLRSLGLQPRLIYWGKSFSDYDLIFTQAVKAKRAGKRIIAFIGDSRIEWGLDPQAIQDALEQQGVRDAAVFNLAMPGRNVRSLLTRLNEASFHPDVLVVGYSHLSFYWSKNYLNESPRRLNWREQDSARVRSFIHRKLIASPYLPLEVWNFLSTGKNPGGGSWLDRIEITERGQARVRYLMPEADAIEFQKKFYRTMYETPLTDEMVAATNAEFRRDLDPQRKHGTKVLLLKMPLSPWALDLETANERTGLPALGQYLGTPALDGNSVPGATALPSFDGLHLTPQAADKFSRQLALTFILPHLR